MVTLPDGSSTQVPVSVLYLARADTDDVCEDGEYSPSFIPKTHKGKQVSRLQFMVAINCYANYGRPI